jgi:hypothetical protein
MGGYGHLPLVLLPFMVIGITICVRRFRSPVHRTILLAAVVTPAPAFLVDSLGFLRLAEFIVPAAIFSLLGLDFVLSHLPQGSVHRLALAGTALSLGVGSVWLVWQGLVEGPTWSHNYGLYGMQWGAKQVFAEEVPRLLGDQPDVHLIVAASWSNGTDQFVPFFIPIAQRARVEVGSATAFIEDYRPLDDNTAFILTEAEYDQAVASRKFEPPKVEKVIPYPDGTPGFFVLRLAYVPGIEQVFAAERAERLRPVEDQTILDGTPVSITHSRLDIGAIAALFDGDVRTLIRVADANPALLDITFGEPTSVSGIGMDFGSLDLGLQVELYPAGTGGPVTFAQLYENLGTDPHIEMDFGGASHLVSRMRLDIRDLKAPPDRAKIHIRELSLRRP